MNDTAAQRQATRWQLRLLLIAMLSWPLSGLAYVTDSEWVLASRKDQDPLVYTKLVEGQPIKAVKAVTVLDAPITTLLTVLSDDELVPDWIPVIGKAELLQDTDANGVSVIYMVTKFPWPIRNRDAVVRTATTYDEGSNTVFMESTGLSGYVEEKDGLIRTPTTYTRWKIQPLPDGKLHVEIITHSDPRGFFPKWLVNMIVTRTPRTMFSRLKTVVKEEQERHRPFNEIHVFGKEVGLIRPPRVDIRSAEAENRDDRSLTAPDSHPGLERNQLPLTDPDLLGSAPSYEFALADRDMGFVDPAIVGTWVGLEDCATLPDMEPFAQGLCYRYGFRARIDERAEFELVDRQKVMTGYTSVSSGRRYLNVKLIDCPGCSEKQRLRFPTAACPYAILQYSTQTPPRMTLDNTAGQTAIYDGRYLSIAAMDRDFLRVAIERGLIDGDPACAGCAWTGGPCITSARQAMQRFVRQYDAQLFPPENWRVYVRLPDNIVRRSPDWQTYPAPRAE